MGTRSGCSLTCASTSLSLVDLSGGMRLGRTSLSRVLLRQSSRSAVAPSSACPPILLPASSCSVHNSLAVWDRRTPIQLSTQASCKTISPTAENDASHELAVNKTAPTAITGNKTAPTAITGEIAPTADQQLSLWRELRV